MTDVRQEDVTAGGTPRAGAGWAWILAYGVISAMLGLFAFFTPFSATFAAVLTVGVMLVLTGVLSLATYRLIERPIIAATRRIGTRVTAA